MLPEQENLEVLRRLLALKRHEQPPPGYFHELHNRIIWRLRAGERGVPDSSVAHYFWEAPWLQRIVAFLEGQPVHVRATVLAACALVVGTLVWFAVPDQRAPRNLVLPYEVAPTAVATAGESFTPALITSTNSAPPAAGQDPIFEQYKNSRNPFQATAILVGQPVPQYQPVPQ